MIETVTAVIGLVSAGIFLAHVFEDYRRRQRADRMWIFRTRPSVQSGNRCLGAADPIRLR
jgi:hypothetical protein